MDKHKQPELPSEQTGHPLLRNTTLVDEIIKRSNDRKEQEEFKIEELKQWKDCINGLAATPNGKLFLTSMIQFSQHFNGNAPIKDAAECKVRLAFYLKWVRPYLNRELRKEVE